MAGQELVALFEVSVAEEAFVSRERRRVGGFQHQVIGIVQEPCFVSGVPSPEHVDDGFRFLADGFQDGVGVFLPAYVLVGRGLVGADRQNGV